MSALETQFEGLTTEQLKGFKTGRSNIVATLSKLCFNDQYFNRAGKLLFRLALAENKEYSNNATGQFTQLFQLYLPGTEASYTQRIHLLNWCLECTSDSLDLILGAIRNALKLRGFFRGGDGEIRGLRKPYVDYRLSLIHI